MSIQIDSNTERMVREGDAFPSANVVPRNMRP
jgi:hypothetical protein